MNKATPKWTSSTISGSTSCPTTPYVPTVTLARTDADTTIPTWLTNQVANATPQVGITDSNASDAGTYNFRITAQIVGSSPLVIATFDIQIIMCVLQQIVAPSGITNLVYQMDAPAATSKALPYTFTPSFLPSICRPPFTLSVKDSTLNVINPPWLTAVSTTDPSSINIPATTDYTLLGNHLLQVTLVPGASIATPAPAVVQFTVQFKCAITATAPVVNTVKYPTIGGFHQSNLLVLVPAWTWSPAGCVTSYTW